MDQVDVELKKIDGKENLTDSFTKALEIKAFDDHKWKMSIRYYPDLALVQIKIIKNYVLKSIGLL